MDWRMINLYREFMYGYQIEQESRYVITIYHPISARKGRSYILSPDYQERYNEEHFIMHNNEESMYIRNDTNDA